MESLIDIALFPRLEFVNSPITKPIATAMFNSKWWKQEGLNPIDIALFQLKEELLCMDFGDFQMILEKALDYSVFTHHIAKYRDKFIAELEAKAKS